MFDSPDKHLLEVSKAVEFAQVKRLPKYSHAHMAVINPIHKERRSTSPSKSDNIKVVGSHAKLEKKEIYSRLLPDHLIRPPLDVLMEPTSEFHTVDDKIREKESRLGKKLSQAERREMIEKDRKKTEAKHRLEEVRANAKILLKQCQLKIQEANTKQTQQKPSLEMNKRNSGVKKSVIAALFNNSAKGIRKLYQDTMNVKSSEKITRTKFLEFVHSILGSEKLTDTEIKEIFTLF